MERLLIFPGRNEEDKELQKLIDFYDETFKFCPYSIKTMYFRPEITFSFIAMNKSVMKNTGKVSSVLKCMIAYKH